MSELKDFYSTFINTVGQIIIQQKGNILPTGGGLISYFPKTKDQTNVAAIKDVIECCIQQMERRQSLSIELGHNELPEISYRICADYEIMVEHESVDEEFDTTPRRLPLIYKIRSKTPGNTVVIGGEELCKKIDSLPRLNEEYTFESICEYVIDSRRSGPYSLYSVSRRPKRDLT